MRKNILFLFLELCIQSNLLGNNSSITNVSFAAIDNAQTLISCSDLNKKIIITKRQWKLRPQSCHHR